MLVIDSDVFVIDRRYKHDPHFHINRRFLDMIAQGKWKAATTIFNVLEVCGVLSFGLNPEQVLELYSHFGRIYHVTILILRLRSIRVEDATDELALRCISIIKRKVSFGDALMLAVAEAHPEVETLITWNARHFRGKTRLKVFTHDEWLATDSQ